MISVGRKLLAFSPSKTKTGKTWFRVSDYNKLTPNVKNYVTIFCNNDIEIEDRSSVVITKIHSVSITEYQGRPSFSMIATVELENVPSVDDELNEMSGSTHLDISPDDLPF